MIAVRRLTSAARKSAAVTTLCATALLAGCSMVPQYPGPLETDFVPSRSPTPTIDRGSLSPDGFTAAQRMTVRVRNIGCSGLTTGTGFAIDANTLVTNHHVVDNSREIEVTTYNGRTISINATAVTTIADLAIVTMEESISAWSTLAAEDPIEGDSVTVVGYPRGGQLTTVSGVVIGKTTDPLGASGGVVYATTAPVEPGSSGSPVLNQSGQVVGVIYAKNDAEQSFMIPVSTLRSLIAEEGLLEPQPNECPTSSWSSSNSRTP